VNKKEEKKDPPPYYILNNIPIILLTTYFDKKKVFPTIYVVGQNRLLHLPLLYIFNFFLDIFPLLVPISKINLQKNATFFALVSVSIK